MQPCTVWIRLKLPDEELRSLKRGFPEVDFLYGEDAARDPREIDAVFTDEPLSDELGGPEFLPHLLPQSDFLVLCLASVPSTERILRERELRAMRRSAYLINLTGGKAIEETLLVRALKEKWIAGAALDAFARQPLPPDSELWDLPNVIISARVAGAAAMKWELLIPIFADNLRCFLAGEPLRNLVDKERGY